MFFNVLLCAVVLLAVTADASSGRGESDLSEVGVTFWVNDSLLWNLLFEENTGNIKGTLMSVGAALTGGTPNHNPELSGSDLTRLYNSPVFNAERMKRPLDGTSFILGPLSHSGVRWVLTQQNLRFRRVQLLCLTSQSSEGQQSGTGLPGL